MAMLEGMYFYEVVEICDCFLTCSLILFYLIMKHILSAQQADNDRLLKNDLGVINILTLMISNLIYIDH